MLVKQIKSPGKQSGVSLIEGLVTIAILGFGLLGLAMMQAQAMKFNTDAQVRQQATLLAYDLMEKMRMNATGATVYTQTANPDACDTSADLKSAVPAMERDCWYVLLAEKLPSGSATVSQTNPGLFEVNISWKERVARETNQQSGISRTQSWTFRP